MVTSTTRTVLVIPSHHPRCPPQWPPLSHVRPNHAPELPIHCLAPDSLPLRAVPRHPATPIWPSFSRLLPHRTSEYPIFCATHASSLSLPPPNSRLPTCPHFPTPYPNTPSTPPLHPPAPRPQYHPASTPLTLARPASPMTPLPPAQATPASG